MFKMRPCCPMAPVPCFSYCRLIDLGDNSIADIHFSNGQIISRLEVNPKPGTSAKIPGKSQSGFG